ASGPGIPVAITGDEDAGVAEVVEITVDGPGVPADVQGESFDPFFTTKEVGKATGLVLTVAYAIVQERCGGIRVEWRPAAGALLVGEPPVSGGKLAAAPPARLQPQPEAIKGASILVVEDEAQLASAVVDALTDAGYIVEHASDGEAGLTRIKERAFDAVICGLKMPRLDGQSFHRLLAAEAPPLPGRGVF